MEAAALDLVWLSEPGEREAAARGVLGALPEWFGDPAARERYAVAARDLPVLVWMTPVGPVGMLALKRHFATTFEVHSLGVLKAHQRRGLGTRMLADAEAMATSEGARILTVKTLGPSRPDIAYAATRAFYLARGFLPMEEFASLWRDPPNPCLFLAKPLLSASA